MARSEILEKIANISVDYPKTEEGAIFLLSKVRKLLETESHPEKYAVLNFYCNLSFHSKIDHAPKKYVENIKNLIEGRACDDYIIKFKDFHSQLSNLFDDHGLPNFYTSNNLEDQEEFQKALVDSWSDTPIRIGVIEEYNIKVDKDGGMSFRHHTFSGFVKMLRGYLGNKKKVN